ncbi:hypothetical protein Tco_0737040 [Tanacetum coccineum]
MSIDKESSVAGTDNRPPMLVESDYESWKIRIERYIRGKPLGKLIWRSIQNRPTLHTQITMTEGQGEAVVQVMRDKQDEEFTEIENNKELADIQATNILMLSASFVLLLLLLLVLLEDTKAILVNFVVLLVFVDPYRLEFLKCNMRLKTDIKPKEATFQVVLDTLALTPFYQAFLITADVPAIYMQEFWATVSVHKSSIRFTINKKKVSLDVDIFREIIHFCPKIPRQKFEDLPLEHDILSFIRDLGHTGDITYLTDIENKDGKKTYKMSYPRFTKIIIDYFMSKDQSISRRNKMFWHTARDDTMFTSMRCISRHEDTQVYGTIFQKELTNQAMLESNAYKTYYTFASGEKAPIQKYVRKKADPDTSPKQKHVQATKGTRLKSKAKVAKPDKKKQPAKKPKAKGLAVLSEVALTKAEQLKLATERSKTQFHSSHTSGSGDGVDTQSKVSDEQQQKSSSTDEGTGTRPGVPDVPIYEFKSEKESWGDSEDKDEDNENDSDDLSDEGDDDNDGNNGNDDDANDDDKQEGDDMNDDDEETAKEEENINDEETMYDDEDDEVTKELYEDMNVNLGNEDTEITNADQGAIDQQNVSQQSGFAQEEEDDHVTLTPILDTQKSGGPTQSSFVSFDFTRKLLNLDNPSSTDNEIASLMVTIAHHATVIPEITSKTTTSFPALPDFAYVFKFNERVFNLEKDLSKIKQVDQQEAQDEKNAYIELVYTLIRALIKEEVYNSLPQISFSSNQRKRSLQAPLKRPSNLNISLPARDNNEQPADKEVTKADWFKKPERPPTLDPDWSKRQHINFRPP